jgi:4-diphosphocytidyl-2-C-methyl-D-erythritol kinase
MLRLTARAKINWTLDITGTRQDGYHLMDMLMSSVELSDTLELEPAGALSLAVSFADEQGDRVGCSADAAPREGTNRADAPVSAAAPVQSDESNLVFKAARALQRAAGCDKGALMRLTKRIPVGGGMGGGSADAAAALLGLCKLWSLRLPTEELHKIALSLGADVPFMLTGGLARVQGIGERIEPLPPSAHRWLVLIQPCAGLSTPDIFKAYDALPDEDVLRPQTEAARQALLTGDLRGLARAMGNVMEPVSLMKRPEMQEALLALEGQGALRAMMTGSGSVVSGSITSQKK